jgi:hypothetical protein
MDLTTGDDLVTALDHVRNILLLLHGWAGFSQAEYREMAPGMRKMARQLVAHELMLGTVG